MSATALRVDFVDAARVAPIVAQSTQAPLQATQAEVNNTVRSIALFALEQGRKLGKLSAVEVAVLANLRAHRDDPSPDDVDQLLPDALDWDELYEREPHNDWLIDDFWPTGRQLHIFAARKSKKSLVMLWCAANLAAGREPFTGRACQPRIVTYLDHEMTEDDVLERLEAMGFQPDDLENLCYYLLPSMPPLDTPDGGARLMQLVERDESEVVIIDTLSRVVKGEENSNDTYQAFYANTGRRLKQAGISMARLDHEGHETGRARGASSKADDVDILWRLQPTDDGVAFVRKASRISWVPEHVALTQRDEPLSFTTGTESWPAGTRAKADELDQIGAPLALSKRQAVQLLTAAGIAPGRHDVLLKALRFRQQRSGTTLGTTLKTGAVPLTGTTFTNVL